MLAILQYKFNYLFFIKINEKKTDGKEIYFCICVCSLFLFIYFFSSYSIIITLSKTKIAKKNE